MLVVTAIWTTGFKNWFEITNFLAILFSTVFRLVTLLIFCWEHYTVISKGIDMVTTDLFQEWTLQKEMVSPLIT